jgi:hypothetical protein
MATRAASIQLHIMDGSGFPNFHIITSVENSAPEAEASIVLTAIIAMRLSVPESVHPGLNPNHRRPNEGTEPHHRDIVTRHSPRLAVRSKFPDPSADDPCAARAIIPPV